MIMELEAWLYREKLLMVYKKQNKKIWLCTEMFLDTTVLTIAQTKKKM